MPFHHPCPKPALCGYCMDGEIITDDEGILYCSACRYIIKIKKETLF